MQAALSHYRILEQIGAGGMGVVYRARDERLDRDVALKVLPSTVVESPARKRFRKEALLLSKLNHPNIATVHDFDTDDGTDFLVEEYIDGLSLDVMLASGPLSETEIINLGSQLAEGLATAHDHGIIHRDLKPANLRVTPEARLKILDFGLAEILRAEISPTAMTESVTETRGMIGTLPYMAPEQLMQRRLDARTDIWATGCVLFEMATARRPFLGSGAALTDAILHEPAASASKLNSRIGAAIDSVIQKCLEKDPQGRYSCAREIAIDLRRALQPIQARTRVWSRSWGVVIALAAVLLGGIATKSWLHRILQQIPADWTQAAVSTETRPPVAHESYLTGLEYLERWDKTTNLDSAAAMFHQAVKTDPNFALGFSALAEVDWAKYRLDHNSRWVEEAEKNCRLAAERNQSLPAVYVTLARIHNGKGQYNLALEEIQKALRLAPRDADAMMTEAAVYASMGQDERAENIYKTAAALRPENWAGFYELGVFYYRRERNDQAVDQFQRALQITPDNALVHASLGGVMQLLHKDIEAEQHLRTSIELQPGYAAYTNLGALYLRERRWAEAAAATRKALQINGSDWSAWANLGQACDWMNRTSEAEEAYRNEWQRLAELVKIRGDDPELQAELGLLYSKWRLQEKAQPLLDAALTRAANDPNILVIVAEAYENFGDRSRALQLLQQGLEHGASRHDLLNDHGLQSLIRDSRFREITKQLKNNSNPAQQQR